MSLDIKEKKLNQVIFFPINFVLLEKKKKEQTFNKQEIFSAILVSLVQD